MGNHEPSWFDGRLKADLVDTVRFDRVSGDILDGLGNSVEFFDVSSAKTKL